MTLIVEKYGGTSVGSVERIHAVADRVARSKTAGNDMVVVVSAMAGETDRLLDLARDVRSWSEANREDREPQETVRAPYNTRELDVLLATGEQVTISLLVLAMMLLCMGVLTFFQ